MAHKKIAVSEDRHTFLKSKAAKDKTTIQDIIADLVDGLKGNKKPKGKGNGAG